ncbi:hypothetical protein WJX82_003653 [Trebouxia sp. C0006]
MVNLAGLHEQLDDLQSHWQNVQRNARQSPGKHQHFGDAVRHPAHADPAAVSQAATPMIRTSSSAPHAVASSQHSSFVKTARNHIPSDAHAREHSKQASNAGQSDLVTNAPLPQISARSSTAAADRHRARYHPTDDTENQWLGSSNTPQSEPSKGKPSQRRRPKPRRPQWQDVSIDLSAGPPSSRQGPAEDPRSAQQVPMQYMRHPHGSGSPGGLHKLHRLLRPISRPRPESGLPDPGDTAMPSADDLQDVNMRLQQVRSCLRHGKQKEEQPEIPSSSRKSPSGPQTARGRRAVGDGGFAGMRLSQVMPALAPLGPRRHTNTSPHPSPSERRSSDIGGVGASNRRQEGLDAWQGQGLDEVLRPVQPLRPVQAGRQRMPPAPGSSAALRSTYAGYVQELQQSGASMGNRLALHAGRQQMGPGGSSAAGHSQGRPAVPGSSQQLQGRSNAQQPGPNIMSLLRRVTYTEKASQLRQADKNRDKSGGDAQTECSICLEDFVMQEQLRRVGCGHLFHPRCIQEWFATGDTRCPMCRFDPVMKRWPG